MYVYLRLCTSILVNYLRSWIPSAHTILVRKSRLFRNVPDLHAPYFSPSFSFRHVELVFIFHMSIVYCRLSISSAYVVAPVHLTTAPNSRLFRDTTPAIAPPLHIPCGAKAELHCVHLVPKE